jgi:Holliday junction resolvase RusA-like endonuclease
VRQFKDDITPPGEPKSTNHIYKSVCRGAFPSVYLSAEGKALKTDYQWDNQRRHRVSITLYFGAKRRADLDNFNKLSLDALTGIAYDDGSQIGGANTCVGLTTKNILALKLEFAMSRIGRLTGKQPEPTLRYFMWINLWAGLLLFAALQGFVAR